MNHFYFSIQLIVLIILGVFTQSTLAQDITQTGMEVDKKQQKIFVNYRITDPSPIIYEYDIQLYYSQDAGLNYQGPLQYLEGHYGTQIIADPQKTIAWNYLQENFDGIIAINTDILQSFLKITEPIKLPDYPETFSSENVVLSLEYQVEKGFDQQGVERAERKSVLNELALEIIQRISTSSNSKKFDLAKIL
jgi:hypothetical protein